MEIDQLDGVIEDREIGKSRGAAAEQAGEGDKEIGEEGGHEYLHGGAAICRGVMGIV